MVRVIALIVVVVVAVGLVWQLGGSSVAGDSAPTSGTSSTSTP